MIRKFLFFVILPFLFAALPLRGAEVYLEPSANAPVIGTVPDQTAGPDAPAGKWHAVPLPPDARVWIADCYVQENGCAAPEAHYRNLPTAAGYEYARNPDSAGTKPLEILEKIDNGKWLRIRPPENLIGYVVLDAPVLPETKGTEKQIRTSTMEGCLTSLEQPISGATHNLAFDVRGKKVESVLVRPGKTGLRLWENRNVRIRGKCVWSPEQKQMILTAEQVSPLWH